MYHLSSPSIRVFAPFVLGVALIADGETVAKVEDFTTPCTFFDEMSFFEGVFDVAVESVA